MELHVFDRSGAFSMESFDIHEEPERFIRVVAGYCLMGDEELGLDTVTQQPGAKLSATVIDHEGKDEQIELDPQPIARTAAIVGRGTSCYAARNGKSVVKFSWVPVNKSPTEVELLKLANDRGVKGAPQLIESQNGTTTGQMRSSLTFSRRRRMEGRRWASGRQQQSLSFSGQLASLPLSEDGTKRKSMESDSGNAKKKSRSNSQASRLSQVHEVGSSRECSQQADTTHPSNDPFVDRVLCVQATSPAGRALTQFREVDVLLCALRDAIKAHQSLLLTGKILHRDVSESNILITDPTENDGFCGMLIDLELGTSVEEGKNTRTGSRRMTGTLKYMAIEVVELALRDSRSDFDHTYRHDLESFFYVFLSICVNHGWDKGKQPSQDPLREWYAGTYDSIVRAKLGDMGLNGFETLVLPKFSPTFERVKGLAAKWRDILFLRKSKLRTGTPTEPPRLLYDRIIYAFEQAIDALNENISEQRATQGCQRNKTCTTAGDVYVS